MRTLTSDEVEELEALIKKLTQHPLYKLSPMLQERIAYYERERATDPGRVLRTLKIFDEKLSSEQHQLILETYQKYEGEDPSKKLMDPKIPFIESKLLAALKQTKIGESDSIIDQSIRSILDDLNEKFKISQGMTKPVKSEGDKLLKQFLIECEKKLKSLETPKEKLAFLIQLVTDSQWAYLPEVKRVINMIIIKSNDGDEKEAARLELAYFATPLEERMELLKSPSRVINAVATGKDGTIHVKINEKEELVICDALRVSRFIEDISQDRSNVSGNLLFPKTFHVYLAPEIRTEYQSIPDKLKVIDYWLRLETSLGLPSKQEQSSPGLISRIFNAAGRALGITGRGGKGAKVSPIDIDPTAEIPALGITGRGGKDAKVSPIDIDIDTTAEMMKALNGGKRLSPSSTSAKPAVSPSSPPAGPVSPSSPPAEPVSPSSPPAGEDSGAGVGLGSRRRGR